MIADNPSPIDKRGYIRGPLTDRHARTRARARLARLASTRPAPGTSDLLGSTLYAETHMWNGRRVRVHDLSRGMTAASLKRGQP